MTSATPRPRPGRLGSRKSIDGCVTCKIRKVKCDELKPACKRCTSTGRKCDGYAHNGNSPLNMSTAKTLTPPAKCRTTYGRVEQAEIQSFEFFMQQVMPSLTRVVDEHFWHQLVPQLSHSDPVIWNAVNAMSCLIRHPQYSRALVLSNSKKPPVTNEEHRTALRWYGKSIAGLQELIRHQMTWSTTCYITCILYICIECLQDNPSEAVAIHRRAVRIMETVTNNQHSDNSGSRQGFSIEHTMRTFLRHLAASQGLSILERSQIRDFHEAAFRSLSDSRDELYELIGEAHEFVVRVETVKIAQAKDWTPPADVCIRQQCIKTKFEKWHSALEVGSTIRGYESLTRPELDEIYCILLLVYGHYSVWLSTLLSMCETAYDNFFDSFQTMIRHAHRAIMMTRGELRPVFVFETRFIPSLFFIAIRCRHPVIRRQAVSLLRKGPRVENIWKADPMAQIAEMSIGIEESGSEQGTFFSEPYGLEPPPESHRLYRRAFVELQDENGRSGHHLNFGRWQQDERFRWFKTDHTVKMEAEGAS